MLRLACGGEKTRRAKDMMQPLGLNAAVDQLTMANSIYGHVLSMEDGHVIEKHWSLTFKAKGREGAKLV